MAYRITIVQRAKKWARVKDKIKAMDPTLQSATMTDIIVPIMGPTGVGKSTFVNTLCGADTVEVGHGLESCTSLLTPVTIEIPKGPFKGRRLILVDTPGFDDTFIDDSEILHRIAHWLAASYDSQMKLAGIIYLYDISQARMLGTTRKNLEMFRKLCGDHALKSVVIATTKWGQVNETVGERREAQLRDSFWKDMIAAGSLLCRLDTTKTSAWSTLDQVLRGSFENNILRIQREVVTDQKLIQDTDAAEYLRKLLEKVLENQKINALAHPADYQEVQDEIRKAVEALRVLKVSFSRRVLIFLGIA